jgi:hypothetical protein
MQSAEAQLSINHGKVAPELPFSWASSLKDMANVRLLPRQNYSWAVLFAPFKELSGNLFFMAIIHPSEDIRIQMLLSKSFILTY